MIRRLTLLRAKGTDPFENLAAERFLAETALPGECILYLWQNRRTVVIGYNQNVWRECDIARLKADGIAAVRRLSGGGAVYHDLGNLNLTFAMTADNYDLAKQQTVLLEACRSLGIDAQLSGRNDLTADGCKFSGNSFYRRNGRAFHNGTLLIDADLSAMGRYLTPSKAKLSAKNVDSVRSRVINLKELAPDLTVSAMEQAMEKAFEQVYGLPAEEKILAPEDLRRIEIFRKGFADPDWTFSANRPYDVSFERRFSWGEICVCLTVDKGAVMDAAVFSDTLDPELPGTLAAALRGKKLADGGIYKAAAVCAIDPEKKADILDMIKEQGL